MLEAKASACHAVEIWREHHWVARAAQGVVPPVVGVEDDDVERLRFGGCRVHAVAGQTQQNAEDGEDGFHLCFREAGWLGSSR